jgi:hypothetical protein
LERGRLRDLLGGTLVSESEEMKITPRLQKLGRNEMGRLDPEAVTRQVTEKGVSME